MRTFDLASLRSFVAVAETGGMTRAANLLNMTQSAVSMQMKRMEEALNLSLFDRSGRGVTLTADGEQLLSYARKMLELNDEAMGRLTNSEHEGRLTLGVPHDIVYPHVPKVLQRFHAEYPRMQVHLISSFTRKLLAQFGRGEVDLTLTTEDQAGPGGVTLSTHRLMWVGAPGSMVWKTRPLPLAFEQTCMFLSPSIHALEDADIAWKMAVEADSSRSIEASLSADLAVGVQLEGCVSSFLEPVRHGGQLPELPAKCVNLYVATGKTSAPRDRLAELLTSAFRCDMAVQAA